MSKWGASHLPPQTIIETASRILFKKNNFADKSFGRRFTLEQMSASRALIAS